MSYKKAICDCWLLHIVFYCLEKRGSSVQWDLDQKIRFVYFYLASSALLCHMIQCVLPNFVRKYSYWICVNLCIIVWYLQQQAVITLIQLWHASDYSNSSKHTYETSSLLWWNVFNNSLIFFRSSRSSTLLSLHVRNP